MEIKIQKKGNNIFNFAYLDDKDMITHSKMVDKFHENIDNNLYSSFLKKTDGCGWSYGDNNIDLMFTVKKNAIKINKDIAEKLYSSIEI